ncbi:MAG: 3-oxoacyl-[acyl-carrier-protein] reductase [Proteobacteria bacterium]|nr:3-oxoacyl-[acyl-carrier-protein] reductase [Pseudomonadota bacterium]
MFSLNGKKALVTGATGGIGGAIAATLHQAGATVSLSGTRQEKLQELSSQLGERTFALPCNLADKVAVAKLAADAEEKMGGLDIIICNAGITKDGLSMRMSDEDFMHVIDINLASSFTLIRSSLRGMMKRRYGRIVTITSIVGVMGNPGQANYAASKAGLIGMSKSIAAEVASRGITVNCIAPGFIRTAMTDVLTDAQKEGMNAKIPMGMMGESQDIANTALFLASEESRYITGQTIHVNGGMIMI